MIKVYIQKIENLNKSEAESIKKALSFEALERLNKKRNEALYLASLCALSLLTDEQRTDLCYSEGGRPHFKTLDNDISISHSKNYVALAISDSKNIPVGIDIEDVPTHSADGSTLTRFFTENEKTEFSKGTPCIEIWTKKEALFKFLKNDSTQFIHLDSTFPENYGASFTTIQIENSILTICTHSEEKIEIKEK